MSQNPLLEAPQNIVDALRPYSDDPFIYIQFSNLMKVGIYPESSYDSTPLGIYAYPLYAVWDDIENNKDLFATDRKYVQVLEKDTEKSIDVYSITPDIYSRDQDKCKDLLINMGANESEIIEILKSTYKDLPSKWWDLSRKTADFIAEKQNNNPMAVWNAVLRNLGYDCVSDQKGLGIIYRGEPIQAVFLTKSALRHIKTFDNYRQKSKIELDHMSQVARSGRLQGKYPAYLMHEWPDLFMTGSSRHFTIPDLKDFFQPYSFDDFLTNIFIEDPKALERIVYQVMHNPNMTDSRYLRWLWIKCLSNITKNPSELIPTMKIMLQDNVFKYFSEHLKEYYKVWSDVLEKTCWVVKSQNKALRGDELYSKIKAHPVWHMLAKLVSQNDMENFVSKWLAK